MFHHQTHPRNVHPYQTTVVPRTDAQFNHSTQQRLKYPWLENPPFHPQECQSTNSSNSENYQVGHYTNVNKPWSTQSQSDGLSSPVYHSPVYPTTTTATATRLSPSILDGYCKPFHPPTEGHTYTLPMNVHESASSAGEGFEAAPSAVTRSPAPSEAPPHGGCGGHCPGFEYVCYYVLQIIFVVGILTGISLCIAGSVLRRSNRGGDLGVLVYIGCLASMVCSLLLGVQCCVRRSNKQRGKQLRLRSAPPDCIALHTIPNVGVEEHGVSSQRQALATRQMQPLLFSTSPSVNFTFPRDEYRSSQRYANVNSMPRSPGVDVNGVPWWRRE